MANKLNPKFKFGEVVWAKEKVEFTYTHGDQGEILRVANKKRLNQTGVVVGGKFKKTGRVIRGSSYFNSEEYDPGYLDNVQTVFVYEVKLGFLNRIIEVLEEDLSPTLSDVNKSIPLFFSQQPPWDERSRQSLREEMKYAPRDSKGRWLK